MKRILLAVIVVAAALSLPLSASAASWEVRLITGDQDLLLIGRVMENSDTLKIEPVYYVLSSVNIWPERDPVLTAPPAVVQVDKSVGGYSWMEQGDTVLFSLNWRQDGTYQGAMAALLMLETEPGSMRVDCDDSGTKALIEGFLNRGRVYNGEGWDELQAFLESGSDYNNAYALLVPALVSLPQPQPVFEDTRQDSLSPFWVGITMAAAVAFAVVKERKKQETEEIK